MDLHESCKKEALIMQIKKQGLKKIGSLRHFQTGELVINSEFPSIPVVPK